MSALAISAAAVAPAEPLRLELAAADRHLAAVISAARAMGPAGRRVVALAKSARAQVRLSAERDARCNAATFAAAEAGVGALRRLEKTVVECDLVDEIGEALFVCMSLSE